MSTDTEPRDPDGKWTAGGAADARQQRRADRHAKRQAVAEQLARAADAATAHYQAALPAAMAAKVDEARADHEWYEDAAEHRHDEDQADERAEHEAGEDAAEREHDAEQDKLQRRHDREQAAERKEHDRYHASGDAERDHAAHQVSLAAHSSEAEQRQQHERATAVDRKLGEPESPFVYRPHVAEPYRREAFEPQPFEPEAYEREPFQPTPYERQLFDPAAADVSLDADDRERLAEAAHAHAMTAVDGEARDRLARQRDEFVGRLARNGHVRAKQVKPMTTTASDAAQTDAAGRPIHKTRMKIGDFGVHAHRGSGQPIEVSRQRATEWAKNVGENIARTGRRPFITFSHTVEQDESGNLRTVDPDARDTAGYVDAVVVADDGVYVDTSIHGDDNLATAAVNGRSLCATPTVWGQDRDNAGNVYAGETLHHVALVPNPAMHGLGGLVRIAASDGAVATYEMKPAASPAVNPYLHRLSNATNPYLRRLTMASDGCSRWREINGEPVCVEDGEGAGAQHARSTVHRTDGSKTSYTVQPHTSRFSGETEGYELKVDAPAGSGEGGVSGVFETHASAMAAKARRVDYEQSRSKAEGKYHKTTHSRRIRK